MQKPTIDDVAKKAGVGRSTVSRVLNKQPNVSPQVQERVMQAVKQLGYRVNLQARQLAGRKSMRIGLIHASNLDNEPNSYFSSALELGATRGANRFGAQLITHLINQKAPDAVAQILVNIEEDQCDFVILTPPFSDSKQLITALQEKGCRIVCVAAGQKIEEMAHCIGIDDWQAGFDVGQHLLASGHRQFGFIKGIKGHKSAEKRYDGFLVALKEYGLDERAVLQERGDFTFRSGYDSALKIFGSGGNMTALICANDDMGAGALLASHKADLKIPEDLAITGFDDTPVSQIVWPPLTTVRQPLIQMAELAVERLHNMATKNTGISQREVVPHHLIVRDSSNFTR